MAENMRPHRDFGRRIKAARALCGLTAIELAEKTEIKISMIRQYEHGRCLPSIERLYKIATALDVTTDYLVGTREKEGVR